MAAVATRYRFTVAEYHRMEAAAVLPRGKRVELIDGEVLEMSAVGSRHVGCVNRLEALLHERLGRRAAIVQVQSPVALAEHHEPEPDVTVLRFRADYYSDALAEPGDVLLIIEVADSSLAFDQGVKLPLYAQAGIPEVWIVDLEGAMIERNTGPLGDVYALTERIGRGGVITCSTLPAITVEADEVLGTAR
ncbi:MAG TPA: Uma2 family endonuclease [Chloroflexota bacterium]|nr:Uma2 family endonuclease [Chloroflexota bacterium]